MLLPLLCLNVQSFKNIFLWDFATTKARNWIQKPYPCKKYKKNLPSEQVPLSLTCNVIWAFRNLRKLQPNKMARLWDQPSLSQRKQKGLLGHGHQIKNSDPPFQQGSYFSQYLLRAVFSASKHSFQQRHHCLFHFHSEKDCSSQVIYLPGSLLQKLFSRCSSFINAMAASPSSAIASSPAGIPKLWDKGSLQLEEATLQHNSNSDALGVPICPPSFFWACQFEDQRTKQVYSLLHGMFEPFRLLSSLWPHFQ